MPEYILPHSNARSEGAFNELPAFVRGYIECIFFTEEAPQVDAEQWRHMTENDYETVAGSFPCDCTPADLAELPRIVADCEAFQRAAEQELGQAYERGYTAEQAGRDFWFTRNGHGVGFWDREILTAGELGAALTEKTNAFGPIDAVYGDDQKIYLG